VSEGGRWWGWDRRGQNERMGERGSERERE
jgi:hypothetical protein